MTFTPSSSALTGFKEWMPVDYVPGPHDVQIGRGREVKESTGNLWFDNLIKSVSAVYSKASTKNKKTEILTTQVLQVVLEKGRFLKKDPSSDRYFLVEDSVGRVTAAQAMRDCLSGQYRSSRHFKQQRRQKKMSLMKVENRTSSFSSDSNSDSEHNKLDLSSCVVIDTTTSYQGNNFMDNWAQCYLGKSTPLPPTAAELLQNDPFEPTPIITSSQPKRLSNVFFPLMQFEPIADCDLALYDLDEGLITV